ncbi:TonB-dependent receptor [Blastochloris viridis]|uniref:TonB dependent receptor n=1 Tax=Blastochloris viridis TaxID=1079 RepID=A0A0H5BQ32_BLAVI|nr:TonB-dependent receptor [Blastochloris viridis]ALK09832.1 TonB dependent receptor [Blastochloris viridis]BAS00264.1 TonB dependent receptor [Blastochloris viridis]CUU42495.1 TonB-dependent hemoglobin/transferrin/lactoferrin receptor family protein [Blastochloris viridis]
MSNRPILRRALCATTALVPIVSAIALPSAAWSQSASLPAIVVHPSTAQTSSSGTADATTLASTTLSDDDLAALRLSTGDTATLLTDVAGVSVYSAGGVSSLPVVNGLADDRVGITVGGAPLTSACGNHMNPILSYVDPSTVAKITVQGGVSPVSAGGDAIAGTVVVESAPPRFAAANEALFKTASVSTFYRSVNNAIGVAGSATVATANLSLSYLGGWERGGNYKAGGDRTIKSTAYETQNHALELAGRGDGQQVTLKVAGQFIPYQAFPNQYMDMVENTGLSVNARYEGDLSWGQLDARLYASQIRHDMDKIHPDKSGAMPMSTDGADTGWSVKATIPTSTRDVIRIGNELQHTTLDDWWPPVAGSSMMSPNTYWNINGGERTRLGTFAEWEAKWTPQWTTLVGVRNDTVWMDTGDVQAYGTSAMNADVKAAAAFNAADRARTDVNFDATALVRYEHDARTAIELGYARKTRSPNLYERYAWGQGSMAMSMIGWFGDGNGYVGNLDLDPEIAHTVSATLRWRDAVRADGQSAWEIKLTPYYSYVENFIDVDRCSVNTAMMAACTAANRTATTGFVYLTFANHDAELYGANLSGHIEAWNSPEYGRGVIKGTLGWVHGENLDTGDNLYHMLPINARLALEHAKGGWRNGIEVQMVSAKDDVSAVRNELATPAYALINLRTGYEWRNARLDLGIDNLLDQYYYLPLGGADLVDYRLNNRSQWGYALAGPGRSFNTRLTVTF